MIRCFSLSNYIVVMITLQVCACTKIGCASGSSCAITKGMTYKNSKCHEFEVKWYLVDTEEQ